MKLGYFHFFDQKIKNCLETYLAIKNDVDVISYVRKTKYCTCGDTCHTGPNYFVSIEIDTIEDHYYKRNRDF